MRRFPYSLFYFLALMLVSAFMFCDAKPLPLVLAINPKKDFGAHIDVIASKMCSKVTECEAWRYRTFSRDMRQELSKEQCEKNFLEKKKESFLRYNQKMLYLLSSCYNTILEAPCRIYGSVHKFHFACLELRSLLENKRKN